MNAVLKILGVVGALSLGAANAQAADPAAEIATAYDWSGVYLGGVGSYGFGKDDWSIDGHYDLDGADFGGGVIGYNHQLGNFVVGAELVGQFGHMQESGWPDYTYEALVDVKVRAGYAADRALFYVSGGYSFARFDEDGDAFDLHGYNIGGGIDFALTENVVLGAEYTFRSLNGDAASNQDMDGKVSTIAAKLTYKF
ncbi:MULTISPECIES: outer membrane protein [Alphaproteobacteria]|uniref:Outer membrane protein n=2 Tax=Alphaproteobacteria TaxID=28211 RepID=A0A512HGX4_9HYPH|nr:MULTISPECIES: outer membrane beta-barrel protein [Alphaproteobacteria]GEO84640.1 outer membrane protein [Ciceribacter naphthalenivorans]GLR22603.1 outer membrane protein [Ciceribacter naphthalenivorans]GLT05459.1 outer membrane protein [Sphingomonas psychrolutea]